MANKNVFTGYFRCIFPHLATPRGNPQKPAEAPKFQVTALFPQNGITTVTGRPESGLGDVIAALDELCRQEFQVDWATLSANHVAYGIQYPPKFNDGNQDWIKDDNGNPIQPFQARAESAGMWKISFKSVDPVDTVAPSGTENISPSQIYGGCWCRAEVQISAYINKNKQKVIAIKLVNVQKAFDDQPLGGGAEPKQAGTQSFANMAVAGTNIAPGTGVVHGAVGPQGMAPAPQQRDTHVINPHLSAQGHTLESMIKLGWDLAGMIAQGHAIPNPAPMAAPAPAPQQLAAPMPQPAQQVAPAYAPAPQQAAPAYAPAPQQAAPAYAPAPQQAAPAYAPAPQQAAPAYAPAPQQASMAPMPQPGVGMAPNPQANYAPAPAPQQAAPAPAPMNAPVAPAPVAQNNDPVIMNAGELTYAAYAAANWTPDALVSAGKAVYNHLNPAG
ncbi:hypothetical protein S144_54 [Shewanella sp. phage 1/44]|uniref:hypothetical protein n=1 Tax=Shewanella sp. phage 1/44 TaxID=1458862 RepID=UPI0004F87C78|nr:hypothetical protein S144_54 [Shewanella sp. phage 1/44]AHK11768.1 hypothetical protein S144_54 [Shewanella sp. phage 1/44]